jgi:hypothetical protein
MPVCIVIATFLEATMHDLIKSKKNASNITFPSMWPSLNVIVVSNFHMEYIHLLWGSYRENSLPATLFWVKLLPVLTKLPYCSTSEFLTKCIGKQCIFRSLPRMVGHLPTEMFAYQLSSLPNNDYRGQYVALSNVLIPQCCRPSVCHLMH